MYSLSKIKIKKTNIYFFKKRNKFLEKVKNPYVFCGPFFKGFLKNLFLKFEKLVFIFPNSKKMKEFDCLPPEMREFALKQHIFFVGSCPLNPDGKINVSPKGHKVLSFLSLFSLSFPF